MNTSGQRFEFDDDAREAVEEKYKWLHEQDEDIKLPKWYWLCRQLVEDGFKVEVYDAQTTVSKYIFVKKGTSYPNNFRSKKTYKIRISNHPPNLQKEEKGDSDFFVGRTNKKITTTAQAYVAVHSFFRGQLPEECPECGGKKAHWTYCSREVKLKIPEDQ